MKLRDYKYACVILLLILLTSTGVAIGKSVTGYTVDTAVPQKITRQHYENVTSTTTLEFDFVADMTVSADSGWIKNNGSVTVYARPNYTFDNDSTMNGIPIPSGAYYNFSDADPPISNVRIWPSSGNLNIDIEASR